LGVLGRGALGMRRVWEAWQRVLGDWLAGDIVVYKERKEPTAPCAGYCRASAMWSEESFAGRASRAVRNVLQNASSDMVGGGRVQSCGCACFVQVGDCVSNPTGDKQELDDDAGGLAGHLTALSSAAPKAVKSRERATRRKSY
jgi:hypothetical protein